MKQENIELTGVVEQESGAGIFKVRLENDHLVICTLSGKMRKNKIRIIPGDKVKLEVSPYDLTRGIITYRF